MPERLTAQAQELAALRHERDWLQTILAAADVRPCPECLTQRLKRVRLEGQVVRAHCLDVRERCAAQRRHCARQQARYLALWSKLETQQRRLTQQEGH
jgi:hypothetical protein